MELHILNCYVIDYSIFISILKEKANKNYLEFVLHSIHILRIRCYVIFRSSFQFYPPVLWTVWYILNLINICNALNNFKYYWSWFTYF